MDCLGEASIGWVVPGRALQAMRGGAERGMVRSGVACQCATSSGPDMHRRHPKPRQGGQGMTPNGNNREG